MLWLFYCPTGIYTHDGPSGSSHAPSRCSSPSLPRRLALTGNLSTGSFQRSAEPAANMRPAWHTGQPQQVPTGAHTVHHLFRHDYTLSLPTGVPHSVQSGQFSQGAPQLYGFHSPPYQALAVVARPYVLSDPPGSRVTATNAVAPTATSSSVEQVPEQLHTDTVASLHTTRSSLVGEGATPPSGPEPPFDFPGFSPFHRRFDPGLGQFSPSILCRRSLVPGRSPTAHQRVRTPSCGELSQTLPSTPQGSHSGDLC